MATRYEDCIRECYSQAYKQALSKLCTEGSDVTGCSGAAIVPACTQGGYMPDDKTQVTGEPVGLLVSKTQRDTTKTDGWVTYPSEIACEITQVLGLTELDHVHRMMQENHARISRKTAVSMLIDFANDLSEISSRIRNNIPKRGWRHTVMKTLNEPTWEALNMLKYAGLPSENARIFSTTATANSGNECAVIAALKLLGVEPTNATLTSTARVNGKTGVSNVVPLHQTVYYDPYMARETWRYLSDNLHRQLLEFDGNYTGRRYDNIYHWGCISQHFARNPLGNSVSSWKLHEDWNLLYTIAMMRHAVDTLEAGGQLCIKIRIFDKAETMGLVAILGLAFDEIELLDNSRQNSTFAIAICRKMTDDDRRRNDVASALANATEYTPTSIFCSAIWINPDYTTRCNEILAMCEETREKMLRWQASVDTIFLAALRFCASKESLEFDRDRLYDIIAKLYGDTDFAQNICQQITTAMKSIRADSGKKDRFHFTMKQKWMKSNC